MRGFSRRLIHGHSTAQGAHGHSIAHAALNDARFASQFTRTCSPKWLSPSVPNLVSPRVCRILAFVVRPRIRVG